MAVSESRARVPVTPSRSGCPNVTYAEASTAPRRSARIMMAADRCCAGTSPTDTRVGAWPRMGASACTTRTCGVHHYVRCQAVANDGAAGSSARADRPDCSAVSIHGGSGHGRWVGWKHPRRWAALALVMVVALVCQAREAGAQSTQWPQRFGAATVTYQDGGDDVMLLFGGYSFKCRIGDEDCHWDDNDWSDDDAADFRDATVGAFLDDLVRVPLSNPGLATILQPVNQGPSPRAFASASVSSDRKRLYIAAGVSQWGRFYNSLSLKYSCGLNDVWVLNLDRNAETYLNWVRLKAHQGTCESAAVGRHRRGQQQFVVAAAVALVATLMQSLLRG